MNILIDKYLLIKLKGGALQFTIAFALLVLMVVLSFLLYNQLRGNELLRLRMKEALYRDIRSASLILEESPALFEKDTSSFFLYSDVFADSVRVSVHPWGFYRLAVISEVHRRTAVRKYFLFSDDLSKNELKPSLYFSDPHRYLSIGGSTYLGDGTWLPAYGVRKAYVNGIGYYRDSLVQGTSYEAKDSLPSPRENLKEMYTKTLEWANEADSTTTLEAIAGKGSLFNSFKNKTLAVLCPDDAELEDIRISGNVILCGKNLVIRHTATLENCIVLARSIKIDDKFKGSGQFIAEQAISTGDSCTFGPPAVFYSESGTIDGLIRLGGGCTFTGDIIQTEYVSPFAEILTLGKGTKLTGQVYCNGIVSVSASVLFGSMFCRGFIYRTKKGVYNNFLLNVCIDYQRLPGEYGGIALTGETNGKKCILEVY